MRQWLRVVHAMAGLLLAATAGWAPRVAIGDEFPSRPIRFVVAYTPGGVVDNTARLVGERMSRDLQQSVLIENRAGANGQIGAEFVAKSAADGYTVLLTSAGIAYRQHLVKLNYDPIKDFSPITLLTINPLLIVVNPKLPVNNLKELIDYAKANPGKLKYGSSGTGGPSHLAGELFKGRAGVDILHVPYKGDSAAIVDVLAGNVDMSVSSISATVGYIKAGRLKAIALLSERRFPMLPDLPTVAESGLPGLVADAWVGILAPANTPPAVLNRLHASAATALADPRLREQLLAGGNVIVGSTPVEFARFMRSESDKWEQVIKAANIQAAN